MPPTREDPVIIPCDGVRVLCSRVVRFVIRHDRIARDRHRPFGHRETCLVPTPGVRARFPEAEG